MSEARTANYTSCCRLCLADKSTSLNSIYAGYSDSEALVEKINALIGVQITKQDKFSTMLCNKCYLTVNNWNGYKKTCLQNQTKLQEWMDNYENDITTPIIQIKEEPIDVNKDPVISLDEVADEDDILVKPEPIDLVDVGDDYMDMPPPLSPHPPALSREVHDEDTSSQEENTSVAGVALEKKKTSLCCSMCDKVLSNISNRKKHEKVMHGLHGGKTNTHDSYSTRMNHLEVLEMPESENSQESQTSQQSLQSGSLASIASGPITEQDQEKIDFAAGLRLQSKSATPKPSELSKIEWNYLEKNRVMLTMFKRATCCCHNQNYGSWKKLLGHLRQLYGWFTPYTCYNCLVVYPGRSGKMRHQMKCPKVEYEDLIRLIEMRARTDDKIRLYQNYKCTQCEYMYSFYADYCEHVDNEHVPEQGPYTCICTTTFDNSDEYIQHIHKSCYLNYFCDICFILSGNLNDFKHHCEEFHDNDDSFEFMPLHPNFMVLNNMQIRRMLVSGKEKQQREQEMEKPPKQFMKRELQMIKLEQQMNGEPRDIKVVNPLALPVQANKQAFACSMCQQGCSSYHNLLKHMKLYHGVETVDDNNRNTCDICGSEFSNYHNMLRHRRVHDQDMKQLECPECPEKFRLNIELKEHLGTIHSTTRPVRLIYRCSECGESFKNTQLLEMHRQNHRYTCEECGKEFNTNSEYEQHRNSHLNITLTRDPNTMNYKSNTSPGNNMCQLCDRQFENDEDLQAHMQLHDTMPTLEMEEEEGEEFREDELDAKMRKYACHDCSKVYSSSRGLWMHNKRYHPNRRTNKDFPKPCDECGRVITTLPAYLMHKQMHTRNALKAMNIKHQQVKLQLSGAEDSDYHTCKRCFKVFANRYNLKTHMKSHGINVSPSRAYTKGKYQKTFWCDICHQACHGLSELNRHKQEHMNEDSPHELEPKVEIIETKRPRKVFMYSMDQQEEINRKAVYCKYCKIPFTSVSSLNQHMENEHEETANNRNMKLQANRYSCTVCGKMFATAGALNTHQGWHKRTKINKPLIKQETNGDDTESEGYKCATCGGVFDDDTTLQLHILEIHRKINTSILTVKCSVCNLEFNSRAEAEVHERLHYKENKTGVLCKYCNKVFSRNDYLNIHINKKHPEYSTVGTFECNQCERVFDKQNALTIHLKVHERLNSASGSTNVSQSKISPSPKSTRVYKYSCSICHTGYDIPKELRNHIITNHPF